MSVCLDGRLLTVVWVGSLSRRVEHVRHTGAASFHAGGCSRMEDGSPPASMFTLLQKIQFPFPYLYTQTGEVNVPASQKFNQVEE